MRIAKILFVCIAVVISLLSFPSVLSWVLLFWLLAVARLTLRGQHRSAATCLFFVTFLAALRGPVCGTQVGFCLVCLALAMLGCIRGVGRFVESELPSGAASSYETRFARKLALRGMPILFLAFGLFAADRWLATTSSDSITKSSGPIVCLGDSLTSGLPSIGGYPPELQKLGQQKIINFGHEGITADEAVPMLAGLSAISPRLVVVELGGHDFLKQQSRASTKADLLQIVDICESSGAQVVLCEIPRGFILDPFYGLEREIARERDLGLIPDTMIRKLVLFSPFAPPGLWLTTDYRLSDDGLHPNAAGNRMLARTVAKYVQ